MVGGREIGQQTKLVFFGLVWEYFDCPAATEMRRERATIETESWFHRLSWEVIVRDAGKHKGIISGGGCNFFARLIK